MATFKLHVEVVTNATGDSSVLYTYLFLLLFGKIDNIYKIEQDSLYFFLVGDSRAFKRKKFNPFVCGFQRYNFLKDFMGEALGILYNQTFFCSGLEYLFIRRMQPTFDMLCLTCPCHPRNDQLSSSLQDYLDTSH